MALEKKPWGMTYDEYCLLPDDGKRYQVLEGELFVSPAPRTQHQRIVGNLYVLLRDHIQTAKLGEIFFSPIDVILAPTTIVQPDVVFVRSDHAGIITELNIQGPPDLCIEVVSPASEQTDRLTKRNVYARYGVQEYWIVDSDRGSVTILSLRNGVYELLCEATGSDPLHSDLFPTLTVTARDIIAP